MTGVGFKDCKLALDETKGDIDKSVEYLRKKGIAKASKKMSRTASDGLVLVKEEQGKISIIEINSETDFVAKNENFISFCKELSELNFILKGNLEKLNDSKMKNNIFVKVRSTGKLLRAKVNLNLNNKGIVILENAEEGISPGQACVFYSKDSYGDKVLGGGWITS